MKTLFSLLIFSFLSIYCNDIAAHNVVGGVYANGADIEGEAGFSNGAMAHVGTVVKVSDQAGSPLGEVLIDEDGLFVFTATKRITHVFAINMGAGHLLKMQLPAEELPESLTSGVVTNDIAVKIAEQSSYNTEQQITSLMLEKVLAKQIKPLRKEIQALKEKSGLRDIIGGIGYIFGLLGLLALIRERKLKANK